jgi:signal transduction histidine kinase
MDDKDRPTFDFWEEEEQNSLGLLSGEDVSTETISLRGFFSRDVTSSGSFDIRGEIWATTFGKVLQSLPIPALLIDQGLHIVVANQACGKLNVESDRSQGTSFPELFPDPATGNKVEATVKEVFSSRRSRVTETTLGNGRNLIWGRMTFRSIRIMADRFILVLVEDLTMEKKLLRLSKKYQEDLERRVEERTAELREMNERLSREMAERKQLEAQVRQAMKMEAIGRMAGGVAHDFNNMLAIVLGNAEILRTRVAEDYGCRDRVNQIFRAVEGAASLTKQLLAFSRNETAELEVLNLNNTIAEFENMLRRLTGEHIQISVLLDPSLEKVHANRGQIEQILMNLAVNARDAMPTGGILRIETANVHLDETYARNYPEEVPGHCVMVAVSDTGVGMNSETQERIFDPFFTTKGEGSGTGLGLSTVYGIVKQHRGHIAVSSQLGQGTTFKVYFPPTAA